MNTTIVELSDERIGSEVRAIEAATRKRPANRRAALGFLRRVGADGWPNSPTKRNGAAPAGSRKK